MNFLGHAHVALATGESEPAVLLGVVLPDLASMAGVRVDRAHLNPSLARGVTFHHAADAAFHADATFVAGIVALRRDLSAAGLASGPSRAVAHAGWELLLDGTLLGSAAEDAFWSAMAVGDETAGAVRPEHRARWTAFLERWAGAAGRLRYDDPAWVADRLLVMLQRRPRLAITAADAPVVRNVLRAHLGRVQVAAPGVLAAAAVRVKRA